jgi:hypothetical protein
MEQQIAKMSQQESGAVIAQQEVQHSAAATRWKRKEEVDNQG